MTVKERFANTALLLEYLEKYKIHGTVNVKDLKTKRILYEAYQFIDEKGGMDLNFAPCLFFFLDILKASYDREFPKQPQTLNDSISEVLNES